MIAEEEELTGLRKLFKRCLDKKKKKEKDKKKVSYYDKQPGDITLPPPISVIKHGVEGSELFKVRIILSI